MTSSIAIFSTNFSICLTKINAKCGASETMNLIHGRSLKCMVRRTTAREKRRANDRSAQMYSAFEWRGRSPGHDELRCVLFLINGTVMEDHFREQVSSTPWGTVRSS